MSHKTLLFYSCRIILLIPWIKKHPRTQNKRLTYMSNIYLKRQFSFFVNVALGANSFASMPSLSEIDLSNNTISTIDDAAFSGLSGLLVLNLEGNQLIELSVSSSKFLNGLSSLTSLSFKSNALTNVQLSSFTLSNLTFWTCNTTN